MLPQSINLNIRILDPNELTSPQTREWTQPGNLTVLPRYFSTNQAQARPPDTILSFTIYTSQWSGKVEYSTWQSTVFIHRLHFNFCTNIQLQSNPQRCQLPSLIPTRNRENYEVENSSITVLVSGVTRKICNSANSREYWSHLLSLSHSLQSESNFNSSISQTSANSEPYLLVCGYSSKIMQSV